MIPIEDVQILGREYGYKALVESVLVGDGFVRQAEVVSEEGVDGDSLGITVVVPFVRQVDVFRLVFGVVEGVNIPHVGVLDARCVACPVRSVGNEQERARRGHGGKLHIVRLQAAGFVNGHAAFANAAAKKVGRYLYHWSGHGDALIDSRQDKSLGSTAGTTRHADPLGIHVGARNQVFQHARAIPGLKESCDGHFVGYLGGFGVTDHIVSEGHGAHARENGATFLHVSGEALIARMSVRAEDGRIFLLGICRSVEVSGYVKPGEAPDSDIFHHVTVHNASTVDNRSEVSLYLGHVIPVEAFENAFANGLGSSFPGIFVLPGGGEFLHLQVGFVRGPMMAHAEHFIGDNFMQGQ